MTIRTAYRRSRAALLAAVLVWQGSAAVAADVDAAPPKDTAAEQTESQKIAGELLKGMAKYLAAQRRFDVTLVCSYDVVQDNGQKLEFSEIRRVQLSRPDKLRIEQVRSDGAQDLVIFDGKDISIIDGEQGVFAQAPQPGSIDDAVLYFVRDLGIRLPLAAILSSRLPEELAHRVKSVDYVESTAILGPTAHHIAAQANTVDFQVWIAEGERPLPLRIVLTYKTEPGQPQFRAQFLDWNKTPEPAADAFVFTPPKDASRIIFAVQDPAAQAGAPAAEPTGNQP